MMENQKDVSRRAVLCGLAVLTLGLVPDKAIAATGIKVLSNGKIEIALAKNPALRKVGGVIEFEDGNGQSIALVRATKAANGYKALNLSCTHEGTIVQKSGTKWVCPNHRAEFSIAGDVKVGPARRNLIQLPIKVSTSKIVVG